MIALLSRLAHERCTGPSYVVLVGPEREGAMDYELRRRFGRRLRLGMVGGGLASLIGETHRMAARLDDRYELVAGSFSSDPARSRAAGADLLIPADRIYPDFRQMAESESKRANGIDVVTI